MASTDTPTKRMPREEWHRLEEIIERFEEAWQGGERPAIDDYLKAEDVAPQKLLLELVHAELECRLKAGEEVRVERYVERYPQLAGDVEGVLELIAAEFNFRQHREPNLTLEDYVQRFPQYGEALPARLLPLRQLARASLPTHLNCPHCHKPMPLSESAGDKQLTCSSCGGSFRFDLAHAPAWSPQALPRLGQFDLLNEIGQGAFGTVYRARDADLGRIVAIKVPRVGRWVTVADQDRFVREARNAAQLAHPGIVPVYEVGRGAPVPYLVSAYVEGITLAKVLAERRFGFREAAEVITQVAEALDHAHQHGVVHRDLKPSNIMLGRLEGALATQKAEPEKALSGQTAAAAGSGDLTSRDRKGAPDGSRAVAARRPPANGTDARAFVMDFGLSRRDEGEITVTIEGQILGTPAYMSPEQARGEAHDVDGRSDVYSLGVILYEMLTGEIPFRGVTRMVLQQIQCEEPRPPRRLNDKIPRDLETITLKCIAKEPNRRYATAGELAADLRRQLNGEPIQARPVGRLERSWRWCKRNPRVAGLLSLVFLLITTVVVGSLVAAIEISQERDLAKAAQSDAEDRLELAIGTLNTLVYEVDAQLRDRPAMHKLKESLLKKAIAGLTSVLQQSKRDDASNSMLQAHARLGDALLVLGNLAEAQEQFKESQKQAEALVAADPRNPQTRRNLLLTYSRLGNVSRQLGDNKGCREYYRKALELAQALASEDSPQRARALLDLSDCHSNCGDWNREIGDLKAALQDHRTALRFARASVDAFADVEPDRTLAKRQLAVRHLQLGEVLLTSGDFEAARVELAKSLELREALAVADRESRKGLRELAESHERTAIVDRRLGYLAEALQHATKSLQLRNEFAKADPQDAEVQRDVARAYLQLGEIHGQLGDGVAARGNYLRSLEIAGRLAAAHPNDILVTTDLAANYFNLGCNEELNARDYEAAAKWYQHGCDILRKLEAQGTLKDQLRFQDLLAKTRLKLSVCRASGQAINSLEFALAQPPAEAAELLFIRAAVLASRGEHVLAAEAAEKLRALNPKNVDFLYDAACGYALCVASVGQRKSAEQLTPEENAARKRYVASAIEILSAAVQFGYKDVGRIESDIDFAAIRQEEGYRALIARLRESLKRTKEK